MWNKVILFYLLWVFLYNFTAWRRCVIKFLVNTADKSTIYEIHFIITSFFYATWNIEQRKYCFGVQVAISVWNVTFFLYSTIIQFRNTDNTTTLGLKSVSTLDIDTFPCVSINMESLHHTITLGLKSCFNFRYWYIPP